MSVPICYQSKTSLLVYQTLLFLSEFIRLLLNDVIDGEPYCVFVVYRTVRLACLADTDSSSTELAFEAALLDVIVNQTVGYVWIYQITTVGTFDVVLSF